MKKAKGAGGTMHAAPVLADKPMKPTTRFEVNPTDPLPTVGETIECRVKGKVCSVEDRKDRYGDGTRRATVEIEHDKDAVTMHRTGKKRTTAEMESANERV